jgi:hypothetical protein
MPAYDREQWERLEAYWSKRANARGTPKWLTDGARSAASATGRAAKSASAAVSKVVPDAVKDAAGKVVVPDRVKDAAVTAGDAVVDKALRPAVATAVHLIELANDWAVELQDPLSVLATARKRGLDVESLADLRDVQLKDRDRLLTRETLKWRTAGAIEGAGMGALALVPVAGIPASIFADVIVMDVLCASIATRVAYSYGFDAKDPAEKEFVESMVANGTHQAAGEGRAAEGDGTGSPGLRRPSEMVGEAPPRPPHRRSAGGVHVPLVQRWARPGPAREQGALGLGDPRRCRDQLPHPCSRR